MYIKDYNPLKQLELNHVNIELEEGIYPMDLNRQISYNGEKIDYIGVYDRFVFNDKIFYCYNISMEDEIYRFDFYCHDTGEKHLYMLELENYTFLFEDMYKSKEKFIKDVTTKVQIENTENIEKLSKLIYTLFQDFYVMCVEFYNLEYWKWKH